MELLRDVGFIEPVNAERPEVSLWVDCTERVSSRGPLRKICMCHQDPDNQALANEAACFSELMFCGPMNFFSCRPPNKHFKMLAALLLARELWTTAKCLSMRPLFRFSESYEAHFSLKCVPSPVYSLQELESRADVCENGEVSLAFYFVAVMLANLFKV